MCTQVPKYRVLSSILHDDCSVVAHSVVFVDTLVTKVFIRQHGVMFRNIGNGQRDCGNVESWKCVCISNTENFQSVICDYCFVV